MARPVMSELVEAVSYYAWRPAYWVEDVLGAKPDPWQAEALEAYGAGYNLAIRSGHGVGKTAFLSWVVLHYLTTRPYPLIPCTAPTQRQLSDLLWAEIARWLNRSALGEVLEWTATRVSMRGHEKTWFAVARTSNTPENLAGFHAEHLLYVIDEASGIPDEIMAVVDGALTTEGAQLVMAGNPTRPAGYFADRFVKPRPGWHTMTISSEDSPRVSRTWIEEMRATWGRDSDVYRVRVLGLPPRGEPSAFITTDLVEAAFERYDATPADGPLEVGVDVARYGEDKSAIAARRGYKVIYLEARHGLSTTQVAAWVAQVVQDFALPGEQAIVRVDDDGIGGGVTDLLRDMAANGLPLRPVAATFGGSGDRWYATNAGVYWGHLRRLLKEGKLALPRDQELLFQLTTRTFSTTMQGKIVLEKKEHMKERGLPSPDKADALALAFASEQGSAWLQYLEMMREKDGQRG